MNRLCTPGYEDGHLTHLVVGDAGARTVKVLMGIANGALFVAPSWVEASLAAGAWLPEKNYLVKVRQGCTEGAGGSLWTLLAGVGVSP